MSSDSDMDCYAIIR